MISINKKKSIWIHEKTWLNLKMCWMKEARQKKIFFKGELETQDTIVWFYSHGILANDN